MLQCFEAVSGFNVVKFGKLFKNREKIIHSVLSGYSKYLQQ